jgi:hypothetical protein
MSMGPMGVAIEEMVRELAEARLRTLERDRTSALISWTDSMIGELEVLNLRDVLRVSGDWRGRLALLFASLPFKYVPRLNAYPWSPTELLDVLFDVQAYLFDLKNGRSAGSAAEADAEARAS